MPLDYIRAEGKAGRLGARLLAIVALGDRRRVYLSPIPEHESLGTESKHLDIPDTDLPDQALGFRVQNYGMTKHRHLFTNKQLQTLAAFCDLVVEARGRVQNDAPNQQEYANAVVTYLAMAVDRVAMTCNSLGRWNPVGEKVQHAFGRQALSMVWDYPEANVLADATGSLGAAIELVADPLALLGTGPEGHVKQMAAQEHRPSAPPLYSTDPPYYDNVPYADLADFFYVWLRKMLSAIYPSLLGTVLVPKAEELVADPFRLGGKEASRSFFEKGMTEVFARMRENSSPSFPTTVYYAFKQTEDDADDDDESSEQVAQASTGWETMLEAMVQTGWQIDGTWPMRTEMKTRMRGMASNALASSIVLVCRPRPKDAGVASRRDFLAALKRELPEALRNLQKGNIAPVDLAQAAIGPGMAVFSRYARVLETDGSPMGVRTALALINQSLDEVLAEQEGEFDADTRWALAWFDQYGFTEGAYGRPRRSRRPRTRACPAWSRPASWRPKAARCAC
jgi:putative DNA methylase